jgi:hypothetical protein
VPATVHAVLAARTDRLPPEAKHLLQTATVIGHEVPLTLLQAIAELSKDTLDRGLVQLQVTESLYEMRLFPERNSPLKRFIRTVRDSWASTRIARGISKPLGHGVRMIHLTAPNHNLRVISCAIIIRRMVRRRWIETSLGIHSVIGIKNVYLRLESPRFQSTLHR